MESPKEGPRMSERELHMRLTDLFDNLFREPLEVDVERREAVFEAEKIAKEVRDGW